MRRVKKFRLSVLSLAAVATVQWQPAQACSPEPYIGAVCITAATYCPRGWAETNGQLLPISTNTALFSLLGTTFGGNGTTTFALPDLRGRSALHIGQGPGLSPIQAGQQGGVESVTLNQQQLPSHSHSAVLHGKNAAGDQTTVTGNVSANIRNTYSSQAADADMGSSAITIGNSGNNQPVAIRDPYLGIRYCIALEGIFPPRN